MLQSVVASNHQRFSHVDSLESVARRNPFSSFLGLRFALDPSIVDILFVVVISEYRSSEILIWFE